MIYILLHDFYYTHPLINGGVNPQIVTNIALCIILIITVMYIKVYISGMEMSQRIHF